MCTNSSNMLQMVFFLCLFHWFHCNKMMGEMQPTLRDIIDAVFEVGSSAAPGHVLQTEGLVWTQHDDLDGARLQQSDLVFCRQISGINTRCYGDCPRAHSRTQAMFNWSLIIDLITGLPSNTLYWINALKNSSTVDCDLSYRNVNTWSSKKLKWKRASLAYRTIHNKSNNEHNTVCPPESTDIY